MAKECIDNPASLSRRLSILSASIRVAGRFPSFRVLPKAIGIEGRAFCLRCEKTSPF
jgi:hypothetical protein